MGHLLDSAALVVDDDAGVRQSLRLCLEADGARVLGVSTSSGALEALERSRFDVVLLDLWLGAESGLDLLKEIVRRQRGIAVVVITAFASFETAVSAMKLGAVDYLSKPFTPDQVRQATRSVVASAKAKRLETETPANDAKIEVSGYFASQNPAFASLLKTAERAAAADCVVLLTGESGTGKNLFARHLHDKSPRAKSPFIAVNCPQLAGDMMSSSLFGHKRGAFTGAVSDAAGKVELASGGTLFLDEIGDLGPDAQARLLRFLNDKTYERLGESAERRADVRLIAATNKDLRAEVAAGRFREDLFFRLNVVSLELAPLRERPEDVLPFAEHFLRSFADAHGRRELAFSEAAARAISTCVWPGNLRELRNAVERAVILSPSERIEPEDLGLLRPDDTAQSSRRTVKVGDQVSLEEVEREHIARVIARAPTLEAAARTLSIDSTTLQRKRKRYGLA
jgi:NtrC-family two-component system response regulator AlgB